MIQIGSSSTEYLDSKDTTIPRQDECTFHPPCLRFPVPAWRIVGSGSVRTFSICQADYLRGHTLPTLRDEGPQSHGVNLEGNEVGPLEVWKPTSLQACKPAKVKGGSDGATAGCSCAKLQLKQDQCSAICR